MFRRLLLAASLALALAVPAHAGSALREVLFSGPPCGGALNAGSICSNVDFNFVGNSVIVNGSPSSFSSLLSVTRAQTVPSYAATLAGLLVPFDANIPRITNQGLLVEESRTNDALWARDLTNAAWTKVNMTTAHNEVGADGVASSATTLTATAGNATVLQTITLGSQADTSSVYLKCITCTGAIQITENNGTAWATCANLITTNFVRCSVTATLANPIIGLRIVNSGDSVIADFFQMEPGGFVTSPIPTTTVAVARNADQVAIIGLPLTLLEATSGSLLSITNAIANGEGTDSPSIIGGTSAANGWYLRVGSATALNSKAANTTLAATPGSSGNYQTGTVKSAVSWTAAGRSLVANNGTLTTDSNTFSSTVNAWLGAVGSAGSPTSFMDGYNKRVTFWNTALPNAQLSAVTQ